jgi:hypothetical protein
VRRPGPAGGESGSGLTPEEEKRARVRLEAAERFARGETTEASRWAESTPAPE